MSSLTRCVVLALLALFWALALAEVWRFPPVGEDEPWIAAAPYRLATEGVWGSELFTGYYGMERRNYHHPPLYPLVQAATFRLAGTGVLPMRFPSLAFGLLVLPLAFAVGRQVGGPRVGLLAMALLVGLRVTPSAGVSGIPLVDMARLARYDVAVAPFVLASVWAFNRAARRGGRWHYGVSGLCAGLAGLCHLYGLFTLAGSVAVLVWRRGTRGWRMVALGWLLAGTLLPWVPWLATLAAGGSDALNQQRTVAARFQVWEPRFYLDNLQRESLRYRTVQLWDEQGRPDVVRPGGWGVLLGLPLALLWALRRGRNSPHAALALSLVVQLTLFALLLSQKHYNYLIALWPLAVVLLAGATAAFGTQGRWQRAVLALLVLLVVAEAGGSVARWQAIARHATPYETFEARIAAYVPAQARVLGLQHYWLGLRQFPYRTWLLPLFLSDPRYHATPVPLADALDQVDPDVILLDRYMLDFLASAADPANPYHVTGVAIQRWMGTHNATLLGVVEDATYGRMEIWWVGAER